MHVPFDTRPEGPELEGEQVEIQRNELLQEEELIPHTSPNFRYS
jgi:hypothetical protein